MAQRPRGGRKRELQELTPELINEVFEMFRMWRAILDFHEELVMQAASDLEVADYQRELSPERPLDPSTTSGKRLLLFAKLEPLLKQATSLKQAMKVIRNIRATELHGRLRDDYRLRDLFKHREPKPASAPPGTDAHDVETFLERFLYGESPEKLAYRRMALKLALFDGGASVKEIEDKAREFAEVLPELLDAEDLTDLKGPKARIAVAMHKLLELDTSERYLVDLIARIEKKIGT